MHPKTVNIYCDTEDVEAGGLLFPTNILSNFDSPRRPGWADPWASASSRRPTA